ncbi:ATP-binding protein [Lacibacterium aquatile]|uniref:histidine kinase n=1 Tax=Lacibacterium aquatile TaxID=1168082 RepID=A0ABW5DPY0_9PROT
MPAAETPRPVEPLPMKHASLRLKFALLVIAFFALPTVIGGVGLRALQELNKGASEISDIWMERLQVVGSLQSLFSDYRRMEIGHVVAPDPNEMISIAGALANASNTLSQQLSDYRELIKKSGLPMDDEIEKFAKGWNDYQRISSRMIGLSSNGHTSEATLLYRGESRQKYVEYNRTLDLITKRDRELAGRERARIALAFDEARQLFLILVGASLLLSIGAMVLVAFDFSRPLLNLERIMRAIASGDIDTEVLHTTRQDEIGAMARTIEVFRDNTMALTNSLTRERELMDQQRNFITMASHEFRTPLTAIDGHARRLQKLGNRVTTDDIEERCGRIRSAVIRMTDLIDSVTRTAQWDDAAPLCLPRPLDVVTLLKEVVNRYRDQHPRRTVELILGPLPDIIEADPKLVEHAVGNLVSNALKYSPPGEPVTVTAGSHEDDVLISVIDRGVGIPETERDRILGRFYRASNVAMTPGTGVGLYFVDQIVRMHSGMLDVDSRLGEGSRFTIRLPIQQAVTVAIQ